MATKTIQNPKTSRQVKVRVWSIETKALMEDLKAGRIKTAKDLSWKLLSEHHSLSAMERSQAGDSAANNFALNVLENALDWSLGMAVLNFIRDCRKQLNGVPKTFEVAASRSGDVFILAQSKSRGEVVLPY